jgi:hypothetical protein
MVMVIKLKENWDGNRKKRILVNSGIGSYWLIERRKEGEGILKRIDEC